MDHAMDWASLAHGTPAWFRDAKFGLFFHWGPYCVPAFQNEWYSRNMYAKGLPQNIHHRETYGELKDFGYKDFYGMFKGERFDPEEWAEIVVRSGAKYAGPVSEHCDNFSMWDSAVNPVNSVNCGPHRDVTGECAAAFRKRGVKLLATFHHQWLWGWFMSSDPNADVYDPANAKYYWDALPLETNRYIPYRLPDDRFNQMWLDKITEVVDKYQPDALYFDSRANIIAERFRRAALSYYYRGGGDLAVTYKQDDFPEGTAVRDIERGRFAEAKEFPWQTDDRLEDNITWCIVQEPKYRRAGKVIHQLCDIVAKNGNLLLNVGPAEDGSFHPDALKELYAIGDWLKINGEAIYGTRPYTTAVEGPSPTNEDSYDAKRLEQEIKTGMSADINSAEFTHEDIRFTVRDGAIYAIALGWPGGNRLRIRALKASRELPGFGSVALLGHGGALRFRQNSEYLEIELPETKPCEHAFAFKIIR